MFLIGSIFNWDVIVDFLNKIDNPWIVYTILVSLVVFLIFVIVLVYRKVQSGSEAVLLWGLVTLKPNTEVTRLTTKAEALDSQFLKLNEVAQFNVKVIKLMNLATVSSPFYREDLSDKKEALDLVNKYYNLILPNIISLFKRETDNSHRVALFRLNDNGDGLVLHTSYAYHPESRKLLGISESKAGYSFFKNEAFYYSDLEKDPTFKRNSETGYIYRSLLCIPIVYQNKCLGVFNIDGEKPDSFDKDCINYITYLVNALSQTFYEELRFLDYKITSLEGDVSNDQEQSLSRTS
ncbi:GAF domain-containing protein [Peribacillus butanolivorans]|uniref:GAF domain-containing protein n=1 Tax=Peribacillus butanolivorans TaxID=421767 RepID=UPI00368A2C41